MTLSTFSKRFAGTILTPRPYLWHLWYMLFKEIVKETLKHVCSFYGCYADTSGSLHSVRTFLTAKITVFSGSLHFFAVWVEPVNHFHHSKDSPLYLCRWQTILLIVVVRLSGNLLFFLVSNLLPVCGLTSVWVFMHKWLCVIDHQKEEHPDHH